MEAHLVFNPNSGGAEKLTPEMLKEALNKAGYQPVYQATTCEEDLDEVLQHADGLVVVAGGDGSLRAVATRLVGKNIPIAPLPLGTANNVATSLGIDAGPLDIIARLEDPIKRTFDIGHVRAPWGEDYFLEAAGIGFYADALRNYDPEKGKSVLRSILSFSETMENHQACTMRIFADGKEITGEYLMVEALNTPAFGPWLKLAPDASSSDGKLNIVTIKEDVSADLFKYVGELLENGGSPPDFETQTAQEIVIEWQDFTMHVDAEIRPNSSRRPAGRNPAAGDQPQEKGGSDHEVKISVLQGAIEFWLPEKVVENGVVHVEENRKRAQAEAETVTQSINLQMGGI